MMAGVLRLVISGVLLALMAFAAPVYAANRAGAVTVSPLLGTHIFKKSEQLKNGEYYGVALGYNVTDHFSLELIGTGSMVLDKATPREFQYYTSTLGFLYHFNPQGKLVPYFGGAVGASYMDTDIPGDDVNEDLLADYGLGFKYFTTDWLALRVDARHVLRHETSWNPIDHGKNYGNFMFSGGLTFQLGGTSSEIVKSVDSDGDGVIDSLDICAATPAGVSVDAYGCPLDSDHDGVIDDIDQCSGTAFGVEVDSVGCEVMAAPATESVINDDLDGDGVPNHLDKCPNTPEGMPVNEHGCLADSDHDGVFDIDDICPQTPQGIPVGDDGCPVELAPPVTEDFAQMDSVRLNIEFSSNSSKIAPQYAGELQRAAAFSKAHPTAVLIVEGHTDNTGSEIANQKLSQHRADTVRWILVRDYGVDPKRIVARGFGEGQPVASNDTAEGRKANRRVLVRLMD